MPPLSIKSVSVIVIRPIIGYGISKMLHPDSTDACGNATSGENAECMVMIKPQEESKLFRIVT